MGIQRKISKRKKKALVGREFDLVLEGPSDESDLLLEGRTPMHAPEIDGKVFVNDFLAGVEPERASFIAARSPRPTTTTWSPGSCRKPMARKLKLKCPICKKPVTSQDADFPFCGERCRLIDLGKWASGAYVISSPVQDTGEGWKISLEIPMRTPEGGRDATRQPARRRRYQNRGFPTVAPASRRLSRGRPARASASEDLTAAAFHTGKRKAPLIS